MTGNLFLTGYADGSPLVRILDFGISKVLKGEGGKDQGEGAASLLAAIVADEPESLSAHCEDVPEDLEAVIMRCLEKDPADRIESVASCKRARDG